MSSKWCPSCEKDKDLSEWHLNASRGDGLASYCKACNKVLQEARTKTPEGRAKARARARKRREKLIEELGGECVCCGEKQYEFLQIDHLYDDGADHRRSIGRNNLSTSDVREYGIENFCLLCANCNFAHGIYKTCPHSNIA